MVSIQSDTRWLAGLLGLAGETRPEVLKQVIIDMDMAHEPVHWSLAEEAMTGPTFKETWLGIFRRTA
jgi:hypothetical protein